MASFIPILPLSLALAVEVKISCFLFFLPGLADVSPEEMRNEAYKANSSGNAVSYVSGMCEVFLAFKIYGGFVMIFDS